MTISYDNYQYDAANRLTQESGTIGTKNITYDSSGQVLTDLGPTPTAYDATGNRTMAGYQTGTGNRISTDGTFTYTYDVVGNLTQKSKGAGLETWYLGYDNQNHLTTVRKTSDGSTNTLLVTYTYDGPGKRDEEDEWVTGVGTTVTRFAWDGMQGVGRPG